METVYLDNNATTQVAPEAVSAMLPVLERHYGNPSSRHRLGIEAAKLVQRAREQVGSLIHCRPEEIVFTSCGTESDNLAIRGTAQLLPPGKRHIITTAVEHPAVKNVATSLSHLGYSVSEISVDKNGSLDLGELESKVTENTGLVSAMYANNETGVMFPVEEIGRIAKAKGAVFHVDAVQAVGKIPIDLSRSTVDLLSLSGHKFHAPKGVGALFVRKNTGLEPQILGGHQEDGLRGGTEAVPNIVALGAAAELAAKSSPLREEIRARRDRLEKWVLENIPDTRLNGHRESRIHNTSNIGFYGVEGEALLLSLAKLGICVSAGAACAAGSVKASDTLTAMKVPHACIRGSLRFSLSRYTTDAEIDYVLEHLPRIVRQLRDISKVNV